MYQISFENIKHVWNQETKTKTKNQETFFYFQVREALAPLNMPTPTPAPDHLLGGHIELGVLES